MTERSQPAAQDILHGTNRQPLYQSLDGNVVYRTREEVSLAVEQLISIDLMQKIRFILRLPPTLISLADLELLRLIKAGLVTNQNHPNLRELTPTEGVNGLFEEMNALVTREEEAYRRNHQPT